MRLCRELYGSNVCVHAAIYQVMDNSPAQLAGIETFFDFIIAIDGIRLVSPCILNNAHH